jgi:hypothetical protein
MLKKLLFSPAQPLRAETRLSPGVVLVSLRGSTYDLMYDSPLRSLRLTTFLSILRGRSLPYDSPKYVLLRKPLCFSGGRFGFLFLHDVDDHRCCHVSWKLDRHGEGAEFFDRMV